VNLKEVVKSGEEPKLLTTLEHQNGIFSKNLKVRESEFDKKPA
jgi:hypothetical protein